jgi:hypothetical protein
MSNVRFAGWKPLKNAAGLEFPAALISFKLLRLPSCDDGTR